jgi:hypothetical protein
LLLAESVVAAAAAAAMFKLLTPSVITSIAAYTVFLDREKP